MWFGCRISFAIANIIPDQKHVKTKQNNLYTYLLILKYTYALPNYLFGLSKEQMNES